MAQIQLFSSLYEMIFIPYNKGSEQLKITFRRNMP